MQSITYQNDLKKIDWQIFTSYFVGKAVHIFNKKYYYREWIYYLIHVTHVSDQCEPSASYSTPNVLPHFVIFLRCGKNSLFIDIHFNKWSATISTINNSIISNKYKIQRCMKQRHYKHSNIWAMHYYYYYYINYNYYTS